MPKVADDMIHLRPQFEVVGDADVDAVKAYLVKFVERVEEGMANGKAPGCLHYDWVWTSDNRHVQCRELYDGPKAVCDHMDYTSDLLPGFVALGVKVESVEVSGSERALADELMQRKFAGWGDACVFLRSS